MWPLLRVTVPVKRVRWIARAFRRGDAMSVENGDRQEDAAHQERRRLTRKNDEPQRHAEHHPWPRARALERFVSDGTVQT